MSLKIAFLLFACCTLVMGYSIDTRTKRQAVDQTQRLTGNTNRDGTTNGSSTSDGTTSDNTTNDGTANNNTANDGTTRDNTTNDGTTRDNTTNDGTTRDNTTNDGSTRDNTTNDDTSNTSGSNIRNPALELGNRFRNAFDRTYQEERDSVADSWNNVKDLIDQRIQTGANLAKTAFDLGTIVPKFGRHFITRDNNDSYFSSRN